MTLTQFLMFWSWFITHTMCDVYAQGAHLEMKCDQALPLASFLHGTLTYSWITDPLHGLPW